MTTREEQLVRFIDNADEPGIVALLAPLGEHERAELLPRVTERVREHKRRKDENNPFPPPPDAPLIRARAHAAFLAWLGVADLGTLPPLAKHDSDNMRWFLHRACASAHGHQVLLDRRPVWLVELANQHLEYGYWMWDPVWRLIIAGVIDRPATSDYLRGVAEHVGRSGDVPVYEMVRRDPALIEQDLPALLDLPRGLDTLVHGDVRTSIGPGPKITRTWSPVLAALPPGHPLRERLLTELLESLGGDLGREASTYHSFMTELRPSPNEYSARQYALLRLAGHRQSAVVSFAVLALSKVDKRHPLSPSDVVALLGPATGATSAATARAAVKLIAAAVKRQPSLAGAAAVTLGPALTHRRPEIQLEAINVLVPYAAQQQVIDALAEAAPELSPTAAAALPGHVSVQTSNSHTGALATALAEAEAFLEQQSDPYLAAALAAARSRTEAAAIDCHPWRDALPRSDPVTPVSTIDELIETVLRVVDRSFRFTSTIERSLDGLAALHNEKPKDFGLRVGPLVARVNKVFSTDQPTWGDHFSTDFCFLVAQWIEPHRQVAHPENVDSPRTWLMARLREVALMIQTGVRAHLLALPTDDSDWVDPAVLAERAVSVGDEALTRPHDVAIAIARLAPWGRAEALKRLHDVPGTLAAVIRVACGGDDSIDEAPDVVRRMVAWHLTRPADGAPYLFGDVAPPTPTKAEFPLNAYAQATITQLPDGGTFMDPSGVPEWQAYEQWIDHQRHTSYGAAWGMSQWPGDADWVWTDQLLSRHNVRSLLDPDASLPPVALGRVIELICDDTAEMRTLTTDVMIQAISDGRLTSPQLIAALATPTDSVASGRLATALVAVAAASPLHRAVVARGLIATAPAWSGMQARPLCTILELLDEIFTADRVGTASIVAREAIGPLTKGRSKTATLATRVLAHEPTERWPADASAVALAARVARAKRRTGGLRTA